MLTHLLLIPYFQYISIIIYRSSGCWLLKLCCARSSRAIWRWKILQRTIQAAKAFRTFRRTESAVTLGNQIMEQSDLEQKIDMANEILKIQYSRNRLLIPNDGLGAFGSISASTFRTTTSMQYTQGGFHFNHINYNRSKTTILWILKTNQSH